MSRPGFTIMVASSPGKYCSKLAIKFEVSTVSPLIAMYHVVLVGGWTTPFNLQNMLVKRDHETPRIRVKKKIFELPPPKKVLLCNLRWINDCKLSNWSWPQTLKPEMATNFLFQAIVFKGPVISSSGLRIREKEKVNWDFLSHRIHGTGIFTYMWHKINQR